MRATFPLGLVLALAASACVTPIYLNEADLARDAKTVVHEERFTLFSPYEATATTSYADSVRNEVELVSRLIPDAGSKPVRLYLVPIGDEASDPHELWRGPAREGVLGMASEGEFAFIYVRASVGSSAVREHAAYIGGGSLRHELTHLYAHRSGLFLAPWFEEGLALEVESMCVAGGELRAHPLPPHLLLARQSAGPGSLAKLLAWRREFDITDAERELRYVWAQALLRYLLEAETRPGFVDRARAIMNLGEAAIQAQEAAWLDWLANLDALERIRRGARSTIESERTVSIGEMPILAAAGASELLTRAADELALEMLADPACVHSAAMFLLFFRASALTEADIAQLVRSDDPALILVAQALRVKRQEPVDLELAQSAWDRVPEQQRSGLFVPKLLVLGPSESSNPAPAAR